MYTFVSERNVQNKHTLRCLVGVINAYKHFNRRQVTDRFLFRTQCGGGDYLQEFNNKRE